MNKLEMLDRRNVINAELNGIVAKAKSEKRKLTKDEKKKFDKLVVERNLLKINNKQERSEKMEKKNFSLFRAVANVISNRPQDAETQAYMDEIRSKAKADGIALNGQIQISSKEFRSLNGILQASNEYSASTYNGGREDVATEIYGIKKAIQNYTCLPELGATVYSGLKGNVQIPVISKANCSFESENGNASNGAPTFSKVNLEPRRICCEVPISKQLLIQGSDDIEAVVKEQILAALAEKLEQEVLNGDGTNLSMSGFMANATSVDASAFTYNTIVGMETSAAEHNYDGRFLINAKSRGLCKTTERLSGSHEAIYTDGMVDDMYTVTSNNLKSTDSAIVYGDFTQLVIGEWGDYFDINVDATSAEATRKGEVILTLNAYVDANIVDSNAFNAIKVAAGE